MAAKVGISRPSFVTGVDVDLSCHEVREVSLVPGRPELDVAVPD
ncbi:hypothetical protein [Paucisalibacillus globulus]|nr:hypothetical protein [Paucisalibacillus globulus]